MVELVQQHHPNMGEVQVRKLLNRAIQNFAAESEIYHTVFLLDGDTVAGQRYYTLDTDILAVKEIFINKKFTPRLVGLPAEDSDII